MAHFERVALFKSNKTKNKDVGNFYDRDYGHVGSMPTSWPLEIEYSIDLDSTSDIKTRKVRVYYNGDGKHPFEGNLPDEDIVSKTFTDKQESFDFLEEMINKYGAKELAAAYEKTYDHWGGTKVTMNCGATWKYITTTLFDNCGLFYSDDFKGDRNYGESKPDAIPLFIDKRPESFVILSEVHAKTIYTIIDNLHTWEWHFVKEGETKSRIDFNFIDYDRDTAGVFARKFKEMIKYNYCFGETIPELVNIAHNLVRNNLITQDEFDVLFANAKVVDPVEIVKKTVAEAEEKFGFEDEREEERFNNKLMKFEKTGPIDAKEYPKVAALAR